MRGADYKTPSPPLMSTVAEFSDLPPNYWREAREAFVVEYLREHPVSWIACTTSYATLSG
jgi:hypothetical protein